MMAHIKWHKILERFELVIEGTLKAYSSGENMDEHLAGASRMQELAEEKGYTVHLDKRVN
jgi:hypothetical protein